MCILQIWPWNTAGYNTVAQELTISVVYVMKIWKDAYVRGGWYCIDHTCRTYIGSIFHAVTTTCIRQLGSRQVVWTYRFNPLNSHCISSLWCCCSIPFDSYGNISWTRIDCPNQIFLVSLHHLHTLGLQNERSVSSNMHFVFSLYLHDLWLRLYICFLLFHLGAYSSSAVSKHFYLWEAFGLIYSAIRGFAIDIVKSSKLP